MNPYAPSKASIDAPESTASPPLRAQFRNRLLDVYLFQLYFQARSPVVLVMLLGLSAIAAYLIWSDADALPVGILVVLMVFFFVVMVVLLAVVTFVLLFVHRDKTYWHPRTLELTGQSVIDSTQYTRHEVQWPAVHKVLRTPWCLYLCPTALTAHCIPRRAFPDPDAFARFSSLAAELHAKARLRDTDKQR